MPCVRHAAINANDRAIDESRRLRPQQYRRAIRKSPPSGNCIATLQRHSGLLKTPPARLNESSVFVRWLRLTAAPATRFIACQASASPLPAPPHNAPPSTARFISSDKTTSQKTRGLHPSANRPVPEYVLKTIITCVMILIRIYKTSSKWRAFVATRTAASAAPFANHSLPPRASRKQLTGMARQRRLSTI
ncbi:hypothetical protein AWB69_07935 [Caballeronia udeis]|uniref:Uncharacterized protein n=1 Tax=Caballeronia udeis TaxID=1232866 RepID=A0A158JIA0_9BURK|nr:hypothetical protein AWB69_07935 [Caballeronia udeis]